MLYYFFSVQLPFFHEPPQMLWSIWWPCKNWDYNTTSQKLWMIEGFSDNSSSTHFKNEGNEAKRLSFNMFKRIQIIRDGARTETKSPVSYSTIFTMISWYLCVKNYLAQPQREFLKSIPYLSWCHHIVWLLEEYSSVPYDPAAAAESLQSCPTLCDPIDRSPSGSPVPGILQARTLEWLAISFSNAWKWKVKGKSLSHVWLPATPWTAAHQVPPPMGSSRQEYWSGVPLPSPSYYFHRNPPNYHRS